MVFERCSHDLWFFLYFLINLNDLGGGGRRHSISLQTRPVHLYILFIKRGRTCAHFTVNEFRSQYRRCSDCVEVSKWLPLSLSLARLSFALSDIDYIRCHLLVVDFDLKSLHSFLFVSLFPALAQVCIISNLLIRGNFSYIFLFPYEKKKNWNSNKSRLNETNWNQNPQASVRFRGGDQSISQGGMSV